MVDLQQRFVISAMILMSFSDTVYSICGGPEPQALLAQGSKQSNVQCWSDPATDEEPLRLVTERASSCGYFTWKLGSFIIITNIEKNDLPSFVATFIGKRRSRPISTETKTKLTGVHRNSRKFIRVLFILSPTLGRSSSRCSIGMDLLSERCLYICFSFLLY